MNCSDSIQLSQNGYALFFIAAKTIPFLHYAFAFLCFSSLFFYNFLEFHLFEDVFTGFRGTKVSLTYNPCSHIYEGVVSKCRILHGRYLATPWLASPHIQTTFLNFFGNPPVFSYRRKLYHASDGGTFALDWLMSSDVLGDSACKNNVVSRSDTTPIVIVIPGLTSDSASPYIKHVVFLIRLNVDGMSWLAITEDLAEFQSHLIAFIMLDGQRIQEMSLTISIMNTLLLHFLLLELALVQIFWR